MNDGLREVIESMRWHLDASRMVEDSRLEQWIARLETAEAEVRADARAKIVIVPAPGDVCGGTKIARSGEPCLGCRACS